MTITSVKTSVSRCNIPPPYDVACLNSIQEVAPGSNSNEVGGLWHQEEEEEGPRKQVARLLSDLALSHQENRELQERLMVSEATVHAQAEQLKDYRDLLSESRAVCMLLDTCLK